MALPFSSTALANVPKFSAKVNSGSLAGAPVAAYPGSFAFGLLGSVEFKTASHHFQKDWHDVLKRIDAERPTYELCGAGEDICSEPLRDWRKLLDDLRPLSKEKQLAKLNRAVNRMIAYRDDAEVFGKKDHWATPAEFLAYRGDCEDYAILKFVSLLELGFDNDQLRVAIVKDTRRRLMHAVLMVQIEGKTLILDSLFNAVVEHQHVLKYIPLYSANLNAQWAHVANRKIRAAFITALSNGASGSHGKHLARAKRHAARQKQLSDLPRFVDWT